MNDSSAVMGEKAKGARGVNLGPVPTARSYRSPRERDTPDCSLQVGLSFSALKNHLSSAVFLPYTRENMIRYLNSQGFSLS